MSSLVKKKSFVKAVFVDKNGKSREFKLPNDLNLNKLDVNKFPDNVCHNEKIKGKLQRECDYDCEDKIVSVFAYNECSNEKYINKLELPPPLDNEIYYGNIYFIAHKNDKLIDLSLDDYSKFYDDSHGGFETLGDEDSWSEEEEPTASDKEFIVSEGEVSEVSHSDSEEESFTTDKSDDSDDSDDDTEDDENISEYNETSSSSKSSETETENSPSDKELKLKEYSIIDEYIEKLDKRFLEAPFEIKNYIFKFHQKNNEIVEEWFKLRISKLKNLKSSVKIRNNKNTHLVKKYQEFYKLYKEIAN